MKKKIVKNKKKPAPSAPESADDVEMPMANSNDQNDVAADYKVFDMSNIAAPVIEFELPNLTERKIENLPKNSPKKSKKSKKSTPTPSEGVQIPLTAEKLNNELVGLRATILKAKNQLMSKLVRQKKQLEAKTEKPDGKLKEEKERKVARLVEEILGLKSIDKDSVAKFAALNTKSLTELKIDGKTAVAERLMYKLATQEVVIQKIDVVKQKYTEWNKTAAFFMQRLGQQYSNKVEKPKKQDVEVEDVDEESVKAEDGEDDEDDVEESGEEAVDEEEDVDVDDSELFDESDVEMVDSDEEEAAEEAAKNRRKLLLGLIGAKEDSSRPALNPKKRKIEDDDDEIPTTSAKKNVKMEMKKVFENQFIDKKAAAPKIKNPRKKVEKSVEKIEKSMEKLEIPTPDEDTNQQTLVVKVNLSKGGKIAKSKKSAEISKTSSKTAPEDVDEEEETPFFFVAKSEATNSKRVVKPKQKTSEVEMKKQKTSEMVMVVEKKKKGTSKSNSEDVHPSWVASQLKKKELAAAKPCGKKITFGDDD